MTEDEVRGWFADYLADVVGLGRGDIDDARKILDHYGVPLLLSTDAGSVVLAGRRIAAIIVHSAT